MINWLTKQFLYGKIFLWLKERAEGLLFAIVLIFLISYYHSEYLDYLDFKNKAPDSNIGLSFIIKNLLIGLIAIGYMYFYFVTNKTKKEIINKAEKKDTENNDMVKDINEFLNDEELKK